MTDETTPTDPPVFKCPDNVPIVYLDGIAAFGVMNGAVQIELATRRLIPQPQGGVAVEFFCSGHLRCSPAAADQLRNAIGKAMDMLQQPQQGPAVASNRLN
jgi:hypothetical protein